MRCAALVDLLWLLVTFCSVHLQQHQVFSEVTANSFKKSAPHERREAFTLIICPWWALLYNKLIQLIVNTEQYKTQANAVTHGKVQ